MESEFMAEYILPAAHYEAAVVCWNEACNSNGAPGTDARTAEINRRKKTQECLKYLVTVSKWESCRHEQRIKQRAQKGIDIVRWLTQKKGWA